VPVVYQAAFSTIAGIITTDAAAFDKAAGGKLALTFDATSIPATFRSIVDDAQTILSTIAAALPSTAVVGTALQIVSAVKTVVLLIEAMVPPLAPAAAARGGVMASMAPMTEADALAVLLPH
ncbi:MAG: hypothetical protein KGL35_11920, partial [Bradyrhizobium sp.]|nr:hypothetical protein [Bradyrhizobium sp.]